jgi:hypothetical protein
MALRRSITTAWSLLAALCFRVAPARDHPAAARHAPAAAHHHEEQGNESANPQERLPIHVMPPFA